MDSISIFAEMTEKLTHVYRNDARCRKATSKNSAAYASDRRFRRIYLIDLFPIMRPGRSQI